MLVILDRDGVINEDSPDYIKSPAEWRPIPGSLAAIAALNRAGHRIVVATNQSGVSRGFFSLATLLTIHRKMAAALAKEGGSLDGIYFCPHSGNHCPCRKPNPGMLQQIAADFHADLTCEAWLIGDSLRDIQTAQAIHCKSALVKTGKGAQTFANGEGLANVPVYENLSQWTDAILSE